MAFLFVASVVVAFLLGRLSRRVPSPAQTADVAGRPAAERVATKSAATENVVAKDVATENVVAKDVATDNVAAKDVAPEKVAPPNAPARLPSLVAEMESDDALQSASRSMLSYVDELSERREKARFSVTSASASDVRKDQVNRLAVSDENWSLLAVADGLTSQLDGVTATGLVIESLGRAFQEDSLQGSVSDRRPQTANKLVWAIEEANRVVCERAESDPRFVNMASTVVAALFLLREGQVCIGHVGDSRAYRLRKGRCQILTADHTLASKGVTGPLATKLYRAVGMKKSLKLDLVIASLEQDDVYLICTDGVTKSVGEEAIAELLKRHEDPDEAAKSLLEASSLGGRTNVACIVARARGPQSIESSSTPAMASGRSDRI
jgi:PPM family protein phosphatase